MAVLAEKFRTAPQRRQAERTQLNMLNDGLLDDEEEEEESKSSDSDRSEAVNDDGHFVEADEFSPDKSLRVGDGGGGGLAEGYQHDEKQEGGSLGDIMRRLKLEKKQHESRAWNDAVVDVGDVNVNRFPVDEESTAMMSPMKKPMNSRELLRKTSQNQQALRSTSVMEVPAHQRHASVGALLATTRRRSASPLGQDMGAALMRSPQQPQSPALPQMNKDTSRSPLAGDVALARLDPALREHLSQLVELVCITKTSSGSERAKPKKI